MAKEKSKSKEVSEPRRLTSAKDEEEQLALEANPEPEEKTDEEPEEKTE